MRGPSVQCEQAEMIVDKIFAHFKERYIMLEVLHNVPLTSLYSPAHEKNAGDCEKQPDFIMYIHNSRQKDIKY